MFIDQKSRREGKFAGGTEVEKTIHLNKQEDIDDFTRQSLTLKENLRASDLDYVYVYATTKNSVTLGKGLKIDDRCIIMTRSQTMNFLGPFADIYVAARDILEKRFM